MEPLTGFYLSPTNSFAVTVVGLGLLLLTRAYLGVTDDQPPKHSGAAARRAYVNGEIGEAELERRLGLALDEDAQRVRELVEPVPGIGPDTSAAVAGRFRTPSALRDADREELETVPGIGEQLAEAIDEQVSTGASDD